MNIADINRIAAIINLIRPSWSTALIAAVLNDERMARRPHTDALIAMTVLALDPTTQKPGRVHEQGAWWRAVEAVSGPTGPQYRTITANDCGICSRPASMHSPLSKVDPHEWEPQRPTTGVGPTPEQRAAIEAAREAAHVAATAAREQAEKREPRDPNEVIAEHVNQKEIA